MGKGFEAAAAVGAGSSRAERLTRFADGLEQLAGRWKREARDPRVAAALAERFGPSAPELVDTRNAVAHLLATSFGAPGALSPKLLLRLHDALADLAVLAAYVPPAPTALEVVPIVDVRSRAQAARLETAARKLLKGLGRALAVGAVGAAVLGALPTAAAPITVTANGGNGGGGSGGINAGSGHGGDDGTDITQTLTGPYSNAGAAAVTVQSNGGRGGGGGDGTESGGNGGGGGDGGPIDVTIGNGVSTTGADAPGIDVTANGGRGGNGGDSAGFDADGGHGGHGGDGGTATVTVNDAVETVGNGAAGVRVVAAGGAGGNGGDASGLDAEGGHGGGGGTGGVVDLTSHADVTTHGDDAVGLLARSAGGAGGDGGDASGIVSDGGAANFSGPGGQVDVYNDGHVVTWGERSAGILASSVGGQAGAGGSSGGLAAFAGDSRSAGDGGGVGVVNDGQIDTHGDYAFGVLAQSVGGGGGAAGGASGIGALGGEGSGGGSGGLVEVDNHGVIRTTGLSAYGVLAQSVGGGGGVGGSGSGLYAVGGDVSSSGNGGAVTVTNSGLIETGTPGGADGVLAHAIYAQSVGGGGGAAGSGGGLVTLGGAGGAAGTGGDVTVNNLADGALVTHGFKAYGIVAESIGGGGGDGGSADGQLALGGKGGGGGKGGTVIVTNAGQIYTDGEGSIGVFAQSVGGGGGNGGNAVSAGPFVNISVGGSGGTASEGGAVTVANSGVISTLGEGAHAIYAQSVGGGGGNGGFGAGGSGGVYGAVSIAVGGTGGKGGKGGDVHVTADGTLTTVGADARGVFAQSVGGGGGDGGFALTAGVAVGDFGAGSGSISVGGTGGDGGEGGYVHIDHASGADIDTTGDRAIGVFAQSIGGGGGNGGWSGAISGAASGGLSAAISVAVGGSAGDGGKGGDVRLDTGGTIHTRGVDASGIFAQSVGGGGGTGGFAQTLSAAVGSVAGAASVSVGGTGGKGGDAGNVTVISASDIITDGDRSAGIYALAAGGGGGTGGWTGAVAGAGGVAGGAVTVGIGGDGDIGGKGGIVDVDSIGGIETHGVDAIGIFAQSIGGGGGSGGFSLSASGALGQGALAGSVSVGGAGLGGGDGLLVDVLTVGDIRTHGDRSYGIYAQSVGGGGGDGGWSGSLAISGGQLAGAVGVSVGGSAGGGGDGGEVRVETKGDVFTEGADAAAILAQSIGGGGGTGGFSLGVGVAGGQTAGSASVTVGGAGGKGGDAVLVKVTTEGQIVTTGDRAFGVQAQSIGGGGGSGGWTGALAVGVGQLGAAVSVGVGGAGGVGGDGGEVQVDVIDLILTGGGDATAVLAQSIGGGGGTGGFSLAAGVGSGQTSGTGAVTVGGTGGAAGDAKKVTVTNHADISTTGDRANGIQAQSIGGGGGAGGFTATLAVAAGQTSGAVSVGVGGNGGVGGDAGEVFVYNYGGVQTTGDDAIGVQAQSIGGGGGSGGFSVAAGGSAGQSTGAGTLTIGGDGGVAGDGVGVTVESHDWIYTEGDRAYAIQATSIGGGGGSGGFSAAVTAALSSGSPAAVSAAIGGKGGAGGKGGDVTVFSEVGAATLGDDAHAIYAQSIGGGGGSGGFSISGALTSGSSTVGLAASIGGSGAGGGNAGAVDVTVDGIVRTDGLRSYGVYAQSVGGGGGDGGIAGALSGGLSANDSIALGVSLGGTGGVAGDGGLVEVLVEGKVLTTDDGSYGVFAQSVGGGGGAGGMAISAALGDAKAKNLAIGLGGSGGGGGIGGTVRVTTKDLIITEGDDASAVYAQSIGGGGGAGGAAGALTLSGGESTNLSVNVGGSGGVGSIGGAVTVINSGEIYTSGEMSHGIFAESVGGGGGHGGMAGIDEDAWSDYMAGGSGAVSLGSKSNNIAIALGGSGGTGDDGGEVRINNSGLIMTTGESQSNAIYAQSVGGGGGDAGVATAASGSFGNGQNGAFAVALGGTGGQGGDGKLVEVINSGILITQGGASAGILAQSIGGGGGAGGDARGFSLSFSSKAKGTNKATSVNVSIGGSGGAAGEGGEVDVLNSGQIYTAGDSSHGVFAQSVGGGGGHGGLISTQGEEIVTLLDMANKGEAKGGQIAIGGSGGGGGNGGVVNVNNSGLIYTQGADAHGVFAQSVGGGGGDGGSGLAGEVSVGGQGGVAGNGGAVTVINTGVIATDGALSRGIFAQSIGGGGGTGGATDYDGDDNYSYSEGLSATMTVVGNLTATKELIDSFSEPAWGISIGGTGGTAGDGGVVTVDNKGAIYTAGDLSHGIFAQSVGGGGGTGGEGTITAVGQMVFSGVGGTAGNGGDVTVTNSGRIVTEGFGAYGIFAQSVGGGGGVAGDTGLGIASWGDFTAFGGEDYSDYGKLKVNPLDGYGGDGGDVKVVNTGDIILLGAGSVGIFAQSVGGGGGLFGSGLGLSFAGSLGGTGDAGTVTVIQNGNIWAGGKNGIGAFFQSQAGDVNGKSVTTGGASTFKAKDIVATLNGDVRGGSVYGVGVLIDGGSTNTITLNGVVSAGSDLAIVGSTGDDSIISNVGVVGNIDLGTGVNVLHSTQTSTLQTLDYVKLNGGLLTTDGAFTPGGDLHVQTTRVEGDLKQTARGVFRTDLDLGKTNKAGWIDHLDVTGKMDLKGKFVLQIMDAGHVLPGDHTATILNGAGPLTASGLQLDAPVSAVATFELKTTADDLNLHYVVDFSPAGFNVNRTAVGDHINNIQLAGSTDAFAPVTNELFWEPSPAKLAGYYDSFSPETYGDQVAVTNFAVAGFTDSMMTCPTTPGQDAAAPCVWAKAGGRQLKLGATDQDMAFKERATGLSMGFEHGNEHIRFGAAASAEDLRTGVPGRSWGSGERYQVGAVLKGIDGPLSGAFAVTAGESSVETSRAVILPSGLRMAQAKPRQDFVAVTGRLAYRLGDDRRYAKPMVEVNHTEVTTHAFAEQGAGALNLVAPRQTDQSTRVSAKLEVGGEFTKGVTAIRPYARVGASQMVSGRAPLFTAAFEGAPPVAGGFSVASRLDKTTLDTELGLSIVNAKGASAKLNWSGQFGDRVSNQALSVKFSVPF